MITEYLYYTREEVCKHFFPDANFTAGAGTWGLHGIVKFYNPKLSFVLFITKGASQAGYEFNENINEDGTFEWDSQPGQGFGNDTIKHLINQKNENIPIYVFYRFDKSCKKYIYLGQAEYLNHDKVREYPVHFIWKLKNWDKQKFDNLTNDDFSNENIIENDVVNKNIVESINNNFSDSSKIEDLGFSYRLTHYLTDSNIITVSDLIKLKESDLYSINKMGMKSVEEALAFISKYLNVPVSSLRDMHSIATHSEPDYFENYDLSTRALNLLLKNNIKTEEDFANFEDETIKTLRGCGNQTINELLNAKEKIIESNKIIRTKLAIKIISKIHNDYDNCLIEDIFGKVTFAEELKHQNIIKIKQLKDSVAELISDIYFNIHFLENTVKLYLNNIQENIKHQIIECLYNRKKTGKIDKDWERNKDILISRAKGQTLQETADKYSLSRERSRQIEKKFNKRFNHILLSQSVYLLLKLNSINDHYIFLDNLYFSGIDEYSYLITNGLKDIESDRIFYIEEYNMILLDTNWYTDINNQFDNFPKILDSDGVKKYVSYIKEYIKNTYNKDVEFDDIYKIFKIEYVEDGTLFTRNTLSTSTRFTNIIKQFFPNGINIFKSEDLNKFRKCYFDLFMKELNNNDRALSTRIADYAIIIGRGLYSYKRDKYISDELKEKIDLYIKEYPRDVIYINSIFVEFEDELKQFGIDNKYYLLGVLKECFANKYYTRRDYISRNKITESYYNVIRSFIINSPKGVTRKEILNEFSGITDVVVSIVLSSPDIVYLADKYVYIDNVEIYDDEKQELENVINTLVSDNQPHFAFEIYNKTYTSLKNLYSRLGIENKYNFYSLIYGLFEDKFTFDRPRIAKLGIVLTPNKEIFNDYVYSFNEISIEEIHTYAKENSIAIYSMIDQINLFHDEFIFKDNETLIKFDNTTFKNEYASDILKIVKEELNNQEYIFLSNIKNFKYLPDIGIEWNEWVLYSILYKFNDGTLDVYMSSNQYRYSAPVVSKHGVNIDKIRNEIFNLGIKNNTTNGFSGEIHIDDEFTDAMYEEYNEEIK